MEELQKIVEPVIYHNKTPEEMIIILTEENPGQERKYPILEDVWYMDGSSGENRSRW